MSVAVTNLLKEGGVLFWDRSQSAPQALGVTPGTSDSMGIVCLGTVGFMANRQPLCRSLGLSEPLSDCEIVVSLYRRHGLSAAEKIAGPFSFVLWDPSHQRMLAAADRSGHYRLYFSRSGNCIRLARTVESLLPEGPSPELLDEVSVAAHIGSHPIPADRTFFRPIEALIPGEQLIVTADEIRRHRYWRLESTPRLRLASGGEYAEAYREILAEVVSEYLPEGLIAITLSGGMDSTSVAAAARAVGPDRRIMAVRWLAPDLTDADESTESSAVMRQLGLEDSTFNADEYWPLSAPGGIETTAGSPFVNIFPELIGALFRMGAASGSDCLLTGLGGDHLFGGMVFSYADLLLAGRWGRLARDVRSHLPRSQFSPEGVVGRFLLAPLVAPLIEPIKARTRRAVPWLSPGRRAAFRRFLVSSPRSPMAMLPSRRDRLRLLTSPQLANVCEWSMRQACRAGIEVRSPLTDHRLREFALSLPGDQSSRADQEKVIVRRAMTGRLPREVVEKDQRTVVFSIALRGFRERESEKVWTLLTDMRAAALGFVEEPILRRHYAGFVAGENDDVSFWNTLTLEAWLREHF